MKANRSCEGAKVMREWTGQYDGKIIQFEIETEKFYLVITRRRLKVCNGEYPAPDLTFKASSKLISDVFKGKGTISDAIKSGGLVLIGAGHEGFVLERLVTTIMREG